MALEDTKKMIKEQKRQHTLNQFIDLLEDLREFKFEEGPSGIVEELYHVALMRQKGRTSG
jgi:phenolic acid decarboxylase